MTRRGGSIAAAALIALALVVVVFEARRVLADAASEAGLRRFRAGEAEAALAAWDRAVSLDPLSLEALSRRGGAQVTLASLAAAQGDRDQSSRYFDRAAADLERVRDAAPHWPGVEYRLGLVRAAQGRSSEAVPLLREALRRDPDAANAWTELARSLLAAGRGGEARDAAEEAARRGPWKAELHLLCADAARAAGRPEEAVALEHDAEACAPRDPAIRWRRARALADLGRWSDAMEEAFVGAYRGGARSLPALRELAARVPDDPRGAMVQAVAERIAGDRDAALAHYERWVSSAGGDARQQEGLRLAKEGDWPKAAESFAGFEREVLARLAPEVLPELVHAFVADGVALPEFRAPDVLRRLGATLARFGRADLALPIFEKAVREDGGRVLARLVLAEAMAEAGRFEDARAHLNLCLGEGFADWKIEDDPGAGDAALQERAMGLRLLSFAHGEDEIEDALERAPRDPVAHYRAGLERLAATDREGADGFFEDALKLDPEYLLAASRLEGRPSGAWARSVAARALLDRAARVLAAVNDRTGHADEARRQREFADHDSAGAGVETGARLEGRAFDASAPEAQPFLGRGFDSVDVFAGSARAAIWVGRRAEIVVDLAEPAHAALLRLVAPERSPLRQRVSVSIDGAELAAFDVGVVPEDHLIDLGGERSGRVRLVLVASLAISPWEWSGGRDPDRRPIAAALSRVEFR